SALMLMDQSGSINSSDRQHFRLDAAKRFVGNIQAGHEAALWRFPSYRLTWGGNRHFQPLVSLTTDTSLLIRGVDALSETVHGSTPMFVAQLAAITYLA